jgi:hypothetical protein
MKPLSLDTSPEAEQVLLELYRKMPAWRKFRCIADLNETMRRIQRVEIRERYPHADEHELKMRLASRWLEPELMRQVFGWDPDKEGY